ncbi:hypothetical protein VNO80_03448 [Phaseolus coccineus]|uniref:Uncharacterized protein n=1 Tax=Phaseolus coccineus TaxID=3886 RepID=A0AAN9NS91_PHACN
MIWILFHSFDPLCWNPPHHVHVTQPKSQPLWPMGQDLVDPFTSQLCSLNTKILVMSKLIIKLLDSRGVPEQEGIREFQSKKNYMIK